MKFYDSQQRWHISEAG